AESATDAEDQETVIGIDLGTTYSCVGVWQNNTVVMVPNDRGQITTPSYVNFTETGKRSVGSAAKNLAARYPATTIYDVKRFIGQVSSPTQKHSVASMCAQRNACTR